MIIKWSFSRYESTLIVMNPSRFNGIPSLEYSRFFYSNNSFLTPSLPSQLYDFIDQLIRIQRGSYRRITVLLIKTCKNNKQFVVFMSSAMNTKYQT
uniref:Uncharacterized protein n=1 Tax=Ascaris lumbricoides TaxID=6252 RepID=A0A0M3IWC7_ASCLU